MMSSEEEEYRYRTIGVLGKGGMGTVWEVYDTALNRRIAFKQMNSRLIGIKSIEKRFLNEARILARLEHPGVVPVHELEVSSENGAYYYTMDKVRGESLQSVLDWIQNRNKATLRRWPLVRLIEVFSRLCETVAFAHEQGILHRDLKPDNVMLGRYGEVFLVDWGIARRIGHEEPHDAEDHIRIQETRLSGGGTSLFTMADNVFGTPGYMSPEAASGVDTFSDGGSDVFALGAILYHILALCPPYQGKDPYEILEAARVAEIAPVAEVEGLKPHLPGRRAPAALAAIAMKALSKERENRYATAQDLRRDIEAFLQGRLTTAEEAGGLKMMQFFVNRNPGTFLVGTLAVISLTGILFFGLHENYQNRTEAEKARDLALEKKTAFLEAQSASNADRVEAAPRFAQLAWERLLLCDVNRAEDLANAALDFKGGADATARSHLVLGLAKVLQGRVEEAAPHWDLVEEEPFRTLLQKARAKKQPVSWSRLLEESGLYSLALKQMESTPDEQFRKMGEFLRKNWKGSSWELSTESNFGTAFYRLDLKKGFDSEELELIRGWPIRHLVLKDVPLADLGRISELSELRILELKRGHLAKDLSPLSELTRLTSLSITPLEASPDFGFDLVPLASLSRLSDLDVPSRVLSLAPLSDLSLRHLRTGSIMRNASLLPLHGMPLQSLEIENPKNLEGLIGMPLEQFRPGYSAAGYSKREINILINLPLKEIRLDGNITKDLTQLPHCRTLENLETDCVHDLKIWDNSSLRSLHLKGNDHDLTGLAKSSITRLEISPDTGSDYQVRAVLHPLLRANQLTEITITSPPGKHPEYHIHLETPALTKHLIEENWSGAEADLEILKRRYLKQPALQKIALQWLPVLETHLKEARMGKASHTWQPAKLFNGHLYQWFKTPLSWQTAKDTAERLGGHLVTIETKEEWDFLEQRFGISLQSDSAWSGGSNRIWIGSFIPGTIHPDPAPPQRNRRGDAPSIYTSREKLVLLPTSPNSLWSGIIEWDRTAKQEPAPPPPPIPAPVETDAIEP